jgi:hypothetical protein
MTVARRIREKLTTSAGSLAAVMIATLIAIPSSACSKDSAAATHGSSSAPNAAALVAGPHADGDHFAVDGALVGPCAANTECTVALKLTVRDEFHVNMEFPHRFTAADALGVEFLGKDPAKKNVFSKTAGDFTSEGPKSGVITVRFKSEAGAKSIGGTLKLGVCSEQACVLPQVQLAVPVTVTGA